MGLKTELLKALVEPFLKEFGERTGRKLAETFYGIDKVEEKKEEEEKNEGS